MKILKFLILIILAVLVVMFFKPQKNAADIITFASWGSQSELSVLKQSLSEFEKETGVKVDFIHIPQNYFQKLHLLYASNLEPDVIFINNQYIKMYSNAGVLEDLSKYFTDEEKNEFYSQALNCFNEDGKLYAIPRDISNLVLYVNKDILKNAGIQYKTKYNDLNELISDFAKLKTDKVFAINSEDKALYWLYYLCANGGGVISDDLTQIILDNKESIEALNLFSDLINKYNYAPTKSQIGSMTTAQMFINGKLAMYLSGRWMVPKFRETIDFNWDITEFPSSSKNKVYIDASGWAISKNSRNKDNAVKLIKFLASDKISEEFAQSGLIVPARKETADKYFKRTTNQKPAHSYIFIEMLKDTKPTPVNENYNKINDIINEKAKEMFSSGQNFNEVFDNKTIKKLERLL